MKLLALTLLICLTIAADGVKDVTAKVGEELIFELEVPKSDKDPGTFEWIFLEAIMDMKPSVYKVTTQNMKINDDGSKIFQFGFTITAAGEDTLSFVHGDISKVDDAVANYKKSADGDFNVADMNAKAYS